MRRLPRSLFFRGALNVLIILSLVLPAARLGPATVAAPPETEDAIVASSPQASADVVDENPPSASATPRPISINPPTIVRRPIPPARPVVDPLPPTLRSGLRSVPTPVTAAAPAPSASPTPQPTPAANASIDPAQGGLLRSPDGKVDIEPHLRTLAEEEGLDPEEVLEEARRLAERLEATR